MHIGLVIYGDLEVISGGYLYNKQLVHYWKSQGHSVTLFSRPWRNYWRHFEDNFLHEWRQQLTNAKIDILIQDELNHPSLIGLNRQLRQQSSYPIVSLVHLLRCTEPHPAVAKRFYKSIEKRYLGQLDGIIHNSKDTAKQVNLLLKKPVPELIAYPGRDHWTVDVSIQSIEERAFSSGPLRILYVGNIIKRKGLRVLLNALIKIDPTKWSLTVIGRQDLEPDYANEINQLIESQQLQGQVQLLGAVPFAKMATYFKSHQLFVMPSFYEPFGIVYIEAMGAGLPIIASTAGAGRELISDGENGFLVFPGASQDLASHLEKLALDRTKLAQMGGNARQKYNQHPTWAETGEKITTFLEGLI